MKPTLGRIVLFNNGGTQEVAIVIAVHQGGTVNLSTVNAGGTWSSRSSVPEGTEPGTWMWPPRAA